MRRVIGPLAIAAVLIAATPAAFGGWAVITVEQMPEYLEAGRPAVLEFTIRQHGREPMDGRAPTVTLRKNGAGWLAKRQRVAAERAERPGRYRATVTPADAGEVVVTIDADWHASRIALLPVGVTPPGAAPRALGHYDRGRQLFVAKGCVTCHAKRDDPEVFERHQVPAGPELTGRQFPAEWLAQKLADPARNRVRYGDYAVMPNLGLDDREIAALVTYVNGRQPTAGVTSGR